MNKKPVQQDARPMPDPDFAEIRALAAAINDLQRQQVATLAPLVQSLIQTRTRTAQEIERTLDLLLDCACVPEGLVLFKKLCRYYFAINPAVTAEYIYAYRDLWDTEDIEEEPT
ncbi:MAG: hypothetical protein JNL67_19765 [Planctomycetaceae bacterium]|nr:hypothetical protein [Planctomycetaceae bacterium]